MWYNLDHWGISGNICVYTSNVPLSNHDLGKKSCSSLHFFFCRYVDFISMQFPFYLFQNWRSSFRTWAFLSPNHTVFHKRERFPVPLTSSSPRPILIWNLTVHLSCFWCFKIVTWCNCYAGTCYCCSRLRMGHHLYPQFPCCLRIFSSMEINFTDIFALKLYFKLSFVLFPQNELISLVVCFSGPRLWTMMQWWSYPTGVCAMLFLNKGDLALEDVTQCVWERPDWPKAFYKAGVALKPLNVHIRQFFLSLVCIARKSFFW